MTDRIKLLPEHVANQIAAGEVVQRPASVVKELLENAVDAGASRVQLIVKDGGKALVQVVDDGCGMSPADALLSFRRHATSKISEASDLFRLHTKGFRGEALASIAAIAQVEMQTREDGAELATRIRIAGDTVQSREEAVAPVGTSISVKNLFFNIPARRNFLKSDKVEYRHVLEEFQRVALAHPGVAFSMVHNDSEVHQLPEANLRQRIVHLFGSRMNTRLVPVREETQLAEIDGFICKPEFAKKSRGEQYFFVNDRFIRSAYLHHAILTAFEGLLKPDTYPGYFLYLQVPAGAIDINIHPTKTEVKFEDEQSLYAILRSAVKHSLGQFSISPVLDFERDPNLETPYAYQQRDAAVPKVSVDRTFNPFAEEHALRDSQPAARHAQPAAPREKRPGWEVLYDGGNPEAVSEETREGWTVASGGSEGALFRANAAEIPEQAGVFQVGRKYLLSHIKSGLLLIDQRRAHQRVIYERFLRSTTQREPATQALLFPLKPSLNPSEIHILEGLKEALEAMGFGFGRTGEDFVEITGLPVGVPESEAESILDGIVSDWQRHEDGVHFSQSDRIAKALAQSLAVRHGTALEQEEQLGLVNDLFGCKEPGTSPFGKPTYVTLSMEELEKKLS
ncbi:DNA mismatch repair endonuclease MutL [Robiginitalea biformata]|uniref:DNA mismatch repair protein MutL n=1 Tax=Robiginitalea biformata (strain ATCC BAA-864 / DSM 15991 / KCTC 12146 / HTCC2501) TaxID=313596 RepID=A4CQ07_ROBBH|nr:DNA mismatch repair endonuclease MutL [Robiginitalea biformata]EAR14092.1 putative DNA mismatch repair protein [Robiginitalea biformata HTCC2501]